MARQPHQITQRSACMQGGDRSNDRAGQAMGIAMTEGLAAAERRR
jgi:hypothetical protein